MRPASSRGPYFSGMKNANLLHDDSQQTVKKSSIDSYKTKLDLSKMERSQGTEFSKTANALFDAKMEAEGI